MGLSGQTSEVLVGFAGFVLCVLMMGCDANITPVGSTDGGGGGGGTLDSSREGWVFGIWTGTFQNMQVNIESDQRETSVWLELKSPSADSTTSTTGDFLLKLPELEGVVASGTFTDVNNSHLIFKVEQSNLSSIGMPGSAKTFEYELANNALMLRNSRLQLILSRNPQKDGSAKSSGNQTTDTNTEFFQGSWAGSDGRGRRWLIKVFGQQRFTIEVTEAGKAMLWMSGVPEFDSVSTGFDAALVVTESAISEYIGLHYKLHRQAPDALTLSMAKPGRLPDEQVSVESFVCTKIP